MPSELDDLSEKGVQGAIELLAAVRETREEYHACTAGELSRRMRMAKSTVVHRLGQLRERGLVEWSDLPGGIHLTLRGGRVLSHALRSTRDN